MAKKKNKKQYKPVPVVSASDNTEKKRLEKARRWAREYTRKVRASRPDDPRFQDGLDYDEIRVKRRISATLIPLFLAFYTFWIRIMICHGRIRAV